MLGAGTMGAQVAAHVVAQGLEVALLDVAGAAEDRSAAARKGREALRKLKPSPLHLPEHAALLRRGQLRGRSRPRAEGRGLGVRGGGGGPRGQEAAVREGREPGEARRHRQLEHLGPRHREDERAAAGGVPPALPGHALLQPAPLLEAARDHPRSGDASGSAGGGRGLRRSRAGKGRRAVQGHPQLHREPHRLLRLRRRLESHDGPRSHRRRGGRLDRPRPRPGQERHLPDRRSCRGGRRGQGRGEPLRRGGSRPPARALPGARVHEGDGEARAAGREDRRRLLQEGGSGHLHPGLEDPRVPAAAEAEVRRARRGGQQSRSRWPAWPR